MPIDPSIALQVKPLQLPDPLEQYGRAMAIQDAQTRNAMMQYQMRGAQRQEEAQNAFRNVLRGAYNPETGEYDVNKLRTAAAGAGVAEMVPEFEEKLGKARTQSFAQQEAQTKAVDARLKVARQFLDTIDPADPNAPQQYIAWHEANHRDPVLGPMLAARGVTADQARGRIEQAIQQGPEAFARLLNESKLGVEKFAEMNKPKEFAPSSEIQAYKLAQDQGFKGTIFDFKRQLAEAGRAQGTNVTVTNTPAGKSLAAPIGQRAEASLVKAEGAAGIMEEANSIREALNAGNVIAGPLAGARMKFAQVLDLAGAGDKEKLVNTRKAIQGLASLTLESRAELKGQGQVTENEQKLLERARSGNIEEMTISELQQIVNVSQRLANRLWSGHQTLLKTMESDPAAADSLRYYRPTIALPQAIGEGKPKAEVDKRKAGLAKIFGE